MSKRLTIDYVREKAKSQGYECLSLEYTNTRTRLKFKCPEKHIFDASWESFTSGKRCRTCYYNRRRTKFSEVKELIEKQGYSCLSEEFGGNYSKVKVKCPEGHIFKMRWDSFKAGHRCSVCFYNKRKKDFSEVKEYIQSQGYECLSTSYLNSASKLKLRCQKGHICEVTWNMFRLGHRCRECWIESCYGENNPNYGNEYTKETRNKISENMPDFTGEKNPFYGKKHTEESRSKISKNMPDRSGPNNPVWNDGSSFEPYCPIWSDKEFKEMIFKRDGYKCMNPLCKSKDPDKLCRHHINYNKKECRPSNIVTLCNSCNSRANSNREWWTSFYQTLMSDKYEYSYL